MNKDAEELLTPGKKNVFSISSGSEPYVTLPLPQPSLVFSVISEHLYNIEKLLQQCHTLSYACDALRHALRPDFQS